MIKFFRKIRQKLLSENKLSKYLLYALGEILLVVIGILIALQINTWNEERKSDNDKQKLMFALNQEFSTNKKALEIHLNGLHKNNAQLNKVINFSAGSLEIPVDSLRVNASSLYYPITLSLLNSVLEEAIGAGKFEILSDSLKQKLSLLKEYTKSRESLNGNFDDLKTSNNDDFIELLLGLAAIPEVPEALYVQPPTTMHPEFIKSDDELVRLLKSPITYTKLIQIYNVSKVDEVWIKYGLLRLTNESIALLDNELKVTK